MRFNYKHLILLIFSLLLIALLLPETTVRMCTVCGVQDYERSIFGKPIELISSREVDELGTYKKWKQEHGGPHQPHDWKEVEVAPKDLLKD